LAQSNTRAQKLSGIPAPPTLTITDQAMATTRDILSRTGAEATQLIIDELSSNLDFKKLSWCLARDIAMRDEDDDVNILQGINDAVSKGLIPSQVSNTQPRRVDVDGKSAEEVARMILLHIEDDFIHGQAVMTLQGLSGTGKTTTVTMLKQLLPDNTVVWGNGVVFRSLTLLVLQQARLRESSFEEELDNADWPMYCSMLTYADHNGRPDLKISGLDLEYWASDIKATLLKDRAVEHNVSRVASKTQAEAFIVFTAAHAWLKSIGYNVIVEGRRQPLDRIETQHKFELTLIDNSVIGKRQAAMRVLQVLREDQEGMKLGEALQACMAKVLPQEA